MASKEKRGSRSTYEEEALNLNKKGTVTRLLMLVGIALLAFAAFVVVLETTRMPPRQDYRRFGDAETLTGAQRTAIYRAIGTYRLEKGTWPDDRQAIDAAVPDAARTKRWKLKLIRVREGNRVAEYLIRMESGTEYRLVVYPPS
jgi:hypothetical protein